MKIISAEFLKSATAPEGYPATPLVEVAFAGRSNVGKSSLINALCQRKKLVRVSNTPGRTRLLNFFEVTYELAGARNKICLCDLPGYGFAKVSRSERAAWRSMIDRYVQDRATLAAVVCIVDGEVGPTGEDVQIIDWLRASGRLPIVVATKIDRISKHRRVPRVREIEQRLCLDQGSVLGVSSVEGIHLDLLWERLAGLSL